MQIYIAFNSLVLLLALIINLMLAFYMLFENRKSESNQAFAGTLFSTVIWILTTLMFLRVSDPGLVLWFRRLTPVGSSLVAGFLLYFSFVFPKRAQPLSKMVKAICLLPGIAFALISAFSPLLIKGFIVQDLHYLFIGQPIWGPMYRLFSIYFMVYYFAGIINLARKYLKAQAEDKLQLWYVLMGFVLSGVCGIALSLLLPIFGVTDTFTIGPIFTLFLAFFVSYAIVRHGLLNVEDFLTRSVIITSIMIGVAGTIWALMIGNPQLLLAFYVVLANLTLGLIVLTRNVRSNINRSFALITFFLALWIISIFKVWSASSTESALFWGRLSFVGPSFIAGLFLIFSRVFPHQDKPFKWSFVFAALLPGGIFASLAFSPYLIEGAAKTAWGYNPVIGLIFPFIIIYFCAYFLLGFLFLWGKYAKAVGNERLQLRYIFQGFLWMVVISVMTNLIISGIFGHAQLTLLGPFSTLIFVSFSTYAIIKHRLMSIEFVIQKSFTYTLATVFITGLYVLVVFVSEQLFREAFGYSSVVLIALAALIISIVYQPMIQFLHKMTSALFFKNKYDYRATLLETSEAIASIIKLEDLTALLSQLFVKILGVKEFSFLLYDAQRKKYRSAAQPVGVGGEKYIKIEIDRLNPVIELLKQKREVLVLYEVEKELAAFSAAATLREKREKLQAALEEMNKLEVVAWVPIVAKDDLVGMITLGAKETGDIFTADDLDLFSILASQIAVALENVRLYEEVLTMKNYNEDVLQSMADGILTTDLQGSIITFNKRAEKITGRTIMQVIGKNCEEIFGVGGAIATLVEKVLRGRGYLQVEAHIENAQAGLVPVSASATLLKDSSGKKMGILMVFSDLTEVKELESKVRQADKLAALGTMAAGMAHEIKNPLSSMKVLSQLMPLKFDDSEFRQKFQEIMPKEIGRIDRIVENLLGFARASAPKFEKVGVASVLDETIDYFSSQLESAKVKLEKKVEVLPEIIADAAQLAQVFSNLILNAIQAMPGGGSLTINAGPGKVSDGETTEVIISFADSGCGMTSEQLNKLFEPFFTTKYGGTGLGLTISHSIIESHGGNISVKSTPGKGTVFTVTLPVLH